MGADRQREAQIRLERDYLAGKFSADEYTRLRQALHEGDFMGDAAVAEPELASWGSRAAALLVDAFVVIGIVVVTVVASFAATDSVSDTLSGLLGFELFLLPGLYHWLMTGAWGQTLGKMAVGIRVVRDADGSQVGYLRALVRVASIWVLAFFFLPLVLAYLWPLWDRRNQTLYDKMARTIVVSGR